MRSEENVCGVADGVATPVPTAHDLEVAEAVIVPHFDAVRDAYCEFRPESGHSGLTRLRRTKFIIDPAMHDSPRHFAACRDDGMLMLFAPQLIDLPIETMVAILTHEFGHAADFAYGAAWYTDGSGPSPARWIGEHEDDRGWRAWRKGWRQRGKDQVEWAADGIAQAVTGRRLGYCGETCCMLQAFDQCQPRPAGLR